MSYRKIFFSLLALAVTWGFLAPVSAQEPYSPNYTRDRAYRHFLNSPARVKTFSSGEPGRVWGYDTPFESGRFYQTPSYYHERVGPYTHEQYVIPHQTGGTIIARPPVVVLPPPPPPYYYPW